MNELFEHEYRIYDPKTNMIILQWSTQKEKNLAYEEIKNKYPSYYHVTYQRSKADVKGAL